MIPLDLSRRPGRIRLEEEIREIVRNTRYEFVGCADAIRILGPDMYYHAFDPHLDAALERLSPPASKAGILEYVSSGSVSDLCLEDSWSGFFIAEQLRRRQDVADLTIIHLDDHADMLPTLLACRGDGTLCDLTDGSTFEPSSPAAWASAIRSGTVGIGCFLVPLFFGKWRTHVRHVNNSESLMTCKRGVVKAPISYDLMPNTRFAAVQLVSDPPDGEQCTYTVSTSFETALDDLPEGLLIVHVDLDYLINDFNGNPHNGEYAPAGFLIDEGLHKLNAFFRALRARNVIVDRWIVATSPGFCCAHHWDRLLHELASEIDAYMS